MKHLHETPRTAPVLVLRDLKGLKGWSPVHAFFYGTPVIPPLPSFPSLLLTRSFRSFRSLRGSDSAVLHVKHHAKQVFLRCFMLLQEAQ